MTARQFNLEIDAEFEASMGQWRVIIRRTGFDGLSRVTKKTRVDTGRARGNWFVNIGEAGTEITDDEDKNGDPTIARGDKVLGTYKRFTGFPNIAIYNNQPYINILEDLDGMVSVTVAELQVGL